MKKLRIAIVGYGRSGRDIHTHLLKMLPELYEIACIVDVDTQRRDMITSEVGCEALSDVAQLYVRKDIDLVVNASFSDDHAPLSIALMEHGFDVLCEKPAARNLEEFEQVLAAKERTGRKYFVFQQYRFASAFRKIKEVIDSGVLGRVVQISLNFGGLNRRWDWQTIHGRTAGSLLNTGPHPVDHALCLMGFPEKPQVFCVMDRANTFGDGEDYAKLLIYAHGGPVADIEISSCNAFPKDIYYIQGTRGTLKGDDGQLNWKYYVESEAPEQHLTGIPLRDEAGAPQYCREKLTFHEGEWAVAPDERRTFDVKGCAFYRDLYDTLTQDAPFEVELSHIAAQMYVMGEAHRQNADLFTK